MPLDDVLEVLKECTMTEGATESQIASLEEWTGTRLPESYLELLRLTNGVEGFVGEDSYLMLWPAEQIAELNEGYSVAEFAPGLILIGSDGGDTGYAFEDRRPPMRILGVPFIGMSPNEAREIGENFEDFLRRLVSAGHSNEVDEDEDPCPHDRSDGS